MLRGRGTAVAFGPVAGPLAPARYGQDAHVPAPEPADDRARVSRALSNMRGIVIVVVVAFHSFLAYLKFQTVTSARFDQPPFLWQAFPIVDTHRWPGFDIFCAWQDVYLMALMFLLSALFTWPSLTRKGTRVFLLDRVLRLGVPFLFAITVVVPIAEYPAYAVRTADPGVIDYARQFLALPFWPNGPMWFLWQLLALTMLAAALREFAPGLIERIGRASAAARTNPVPFVAGLAGAAVLAYVPMAVGFTPFRWSEHGPLSLQFCRPLLYAVLYVAGLGIGASGLPRGLLAPDGLLARRWSLWLAAALLSFFAWMGLMALTLSDGDAAPLLLRIVVDASFAIACVTGGCCAIAMCLRFATGRSRALDGLSDSAMGIYLLHYPFVVWLQFALLGLALPAVVKGLCVCALSLLAAWSLTVALRRVPLGAALIGEARRGPGATASPAANPARRPVGKFPPANLARP